MSASEGGDRARLPAGAVLAGIDELEVTVEKLVAGGEGLARHGRIPIFVPRSAPGDRLRVRIVERRTGYARAEIVEVLSPGPDRREPPCPHFETCGGCDLQQIEDSAQTAHKAAAVRETLERLGRVTWPETVEVIAGEAWGYRLRCGLRVEPRDEGLAVGYRERGSHRLVPIETCPILAPELEAAALGLGARLGAGAPTRIDLALGDDGRVTASPVVAEVGRGEVTRTVGGFQLAFDARTFFQAHRGLLDDLVLHTVGSHRGETAVDLYAGVGLFTLALSHRYRQVVAVEGDRMAVRYLRRNLRQNRISGVEVEGRAVESWIRSLPADIDRMVVDPPRRGLGRAVVVALRGRPPRRLTYVSCHPAALARDLEALAVAYRLDRLALVDLFPQTGHIEVVAQLERRSSAG